jgi:RNA polymerase sigma-70 factor (ECF subfamily)
MSDLNSRSLITHELLPRAVAGDGAAVDALLRHWGDRLTVLTRRMLGDFQRVRRWAETDDVLQNALVRLVGALHDVKPQTPREFLSLASLQIRRELLDLARHFYGPEGIGANHDSRPPADANGSGAFDPVDVRNEPASLAQWTELHELIETLAAEDREVIGLLFYQGLSQAEAAEVLNVSLRTVQRRWHDALCHLHRAWSGTAGSVG